jgi:competence protein ComEA
VVDAVEAAGGLRPGARLGAVNLARAVVDGERIDVGADTAATVPPGAGPASTAGAGTAGTTLDLNTATQAQLEELPGVGPVLAGRILAWRTENGRFSAVEELQEVAGIGDATYAELAPLVRV